MSTALATKATTKKDAVNVAFLSSNHKVMHYLQNSQLCPVTMTHNHHPLATIHKTPSHTHDLFTVKEPQQQQQQQRRIRSCSEDGSASSVNDTLSRSDFSVGSSTSDPGGHFSSNTSSSGICSTFSDGGHEEGTSTSSEELDFNLGFDQISDTGDNDDFEVANLDDIDEDDEEQRISNKNSADTATLLDAGETNLDARINELEEFLRKSYSSSNDDDDEYEFNNDDTITADNSKQKHQRASFLNASTYTICPNERFSTFTGGDDQEAEQIMGRGFTGIRSNSLGIVQVDRKSAILDKAPKKVVRFADMLGLDLESIRYMTPPDQSTTSLIHECIRVKLEQLRLAKSQSPLASCSSLTAANSVPISSSTLVSSPSVSLKHSPQLYLVSKNFTCPTNLIPLIYERQIMLECLYTKDVAAYGTVRVHNCAYDKRVFARVSQDEWATSHEVQAWHSMNYANDNTDTFTFEIRLLKSNDETVVPKRILFSVCLQAMWQEFWDNKQGWNYSLDVLERR